MFNTDGKYIVVEGIDGSGKTTLAKSLVNYINENCEVGAVYLSEPSDLNIMTAIRETAEDEDLRNKEEILANLFAADRLLLKDVIFDYNYSGAHVIVDRSKFSSYAYQNVDMFYNMFLNQYMIDPDIIYHLDIEPRVALDRISEKDKFENIDTLSDARDWYNNYLGQMSAELGIKYKKLNVSTYTKEQVFSFYKRNLEALGVIT